MTIGYTLGIPASGDNPSIDQPNMRVNNDNNSLIWGIDHYTFGDTTASNGTHKQVTFPLNVVPGLPVTSPTLFTNNDAFNVAQLFYYTGTNAQGANQYVAGVNGSVLLMGGIIVKWGTVVLPGTGASQTVTYPVAFPHGCFAVNAIKSDTVSTATLSFLTNFAGVPNTFQAVKSSASSTLQITYIAIGN